MTVPVGVRPMLRLVLSEASGSSSARIERALGFLLEELGMDVAFVGEFDDGALVVTHTATDAALQAVVDELRDLDVVRDVASVMRVEGQA